MFSWQPVLAGVLQESILGTLFFLNNLPDGLKSNVKLFADDTSLFSVVTNTEESASDLANDFDTISQWVYNWKMSFNLDPLFSHKKTKNNSNITHPIIYFNNFQPKRADQQKHLGIIFDEKLNFKSHIDKILTKTSKGIAVIKRLRNFLLRKLLIAIYKAIIRLHVDDGDILYDQPNHVSFCQKIESFQHKAALAITGAIQGTSQEKLLEEFDLETLKSRK